MSELSASVKGLETDKERLTREVATMTVTMRSLQEELAATKDEGQKAGDATMTRMTMTMITITTVMIMTMMMMCIF